MQCFSKLNRSRVRAPLFAASSPASDSSLRCCSCVVSSYRVVRLARLPSLLSLLRPVAARTPQLPLLHLRRSIITTSPAVTPEQRVERYPLSKEADEGVIVPWRVAVRFVDQVEQGGGWNSSIVRKFKKRAFDDGNGGFTIFTYRNLDGERVNAVSPEQLRRFLRSALPAERSLDTLDEMWKSTSSYSVERQVGERHNFATQSDMFEHFKRMNAETNELRGAKKQGTSGAAASLAAEDEERPLSRAADPIVEEGGKAKRKRDAAVPVAASSVPPALKRSRSVTTTSPSTPLRPSRSASYAPTSTPHNRSSTTLHSHSDSALKRSRSALSASVPLAYPSPSPTPSPAPSPAPSPEPPVPSASEEDAALLEAKRNARKQFELSSLRHAYEQASKQGGAAFVALDVEFWERDHDVLLEFGWSVVEFTKKEDGSIKARREDQHAAVKENLRFKNGRFAPNARDHFDFGRTLTLPKQVLFQLLSALLATLSATQPVYLIFHDPRADLRALGQLGFSPEREFVKDLQRLPAAFCGEGEKGYELEGNVWVVDTQRLFEAWSTRKCQIGLGKACTEMEVPTKRLHNAGNDAHYTLDLFERLMDPSRQPSPDSPLMREIDQRAEAAAVKKAEARKERERKEQEVLERVV